LASAELASSKRNTRTNDKRAHSLWSTEFVRTQTERIDERACFSDICPAERLYRICMKHRIRRRSAHDLCKSSQIGDNTGFIVNGHERDNPHWPFVKYPPKFRGINDSVAIDADHTSAKRFNGIKDGMVFHCTADRNAIDRTKTENREIVRFSAATRENNVAWFGPNECGEFLSGVID
jgi:hypothetical protein